MSYKTICLIPAAGSGTRVGGDLPKQYRMLAGLPMLRRTVLAFINHADVDAVCIIYNPEDADLYEQAVGDLDILPPIEGGSTRQESVRLGLKSLKEYSPTKILIHDAARPLVTHNLISRVVDAIDEHKSVIPALAVEDTLKKCSNGKIIHTVNRTDLMRAQTPQGFIYTEILSAHDKAASEELTDDAAVIEHTGDEVVTVEGSQTNFKITHIDDFQRAERIMPNEYETRVGSGFDVHKFCIPKAKTDNSIMLCGVAIPHDKSLEGHSDADVGLHAIVDAILGAIAEGDIGDHFLPSDNTYKDMDSSEFLKHADSLMQKKGGSIVNIDLTIICEQPKIGKYKKDMAKKVADVLNIEATKVNIKATTTEGLGFAGRGEGIAAQAITLIKGIS